MKKIVIILFIICCCLVAFGQKKQTKPNSEMIDFTFKYYFLEAEKNKILGKHEMALAFLLEANKLKPQEACVYYQIANLLMMNQDIINAKIYAEKAVNYDKTNNIFYIKTLLNCLILSNDLDGAIRMFENLLKTTDDISCYLDLSTLYVEKKDYKKAIKTLNSAEKKFGINEHTSIGKEIVYLKQDKIQEAVNEIVKLQKAFPKEERYKAMLGETYQNVGDTKNAQKWFAEVENADNLDGYICLSIANFYQSEKKYNKCFEFVAKAFADPNVSLDIKEQIIFNFINDVNFTRAYPTEIKNLIVPLIQENPDSVTFYAFMADYYLNINDLKSAQSVLETVLSKDKSKYKIWEQLLYIDYSINDYEKMYKHGKEAVELYPNYMELYKYYVMAAYIQKQYNDVVTAVDYASQLAISDKESLLDFWSMQADAYYNMEKYFQSDSVFELILKKDPNNIGALNNYAYFLSERGEKLEKALQMGEKMISIGVTDPIYFDTYAWILYKNEKYAEALEYIEKAITGDNTKYIYYDHKGDILFKLNRREEAVKMWEKAKMLGQNDEILNNKISTKTLIE